MLIIFLSNDPKLKAKCKFIRIYYNKRQIPISLENVNNFKTN